MVKHFLHELKKETKGDIPRFAQFLCLFPKFMFFSILFEGQAPELGNKISQNLLSGQLQVQQFPGPLAVSSSEKVKNNSSQYPVAV